MSRPVNDKRNIKIIKINKKYKGKILLTLSNIVNLIFNVSTFN